MIGHSQKVLKVKRSQIHEKKGNLPAPDREYPARGLLTRKMFGTEIGEWMDK